LPRLLLRGRAVPEGSRRVRLARAARRRAPLPSQGRAGIVTTLDDLELELRKLPGVHSAGFEERDDVLLIQLHAGAERGAQPLPVAATRIAARHSDRPVAVEVVRWRNAPEARLATPATPEALGTGASARE